MTYDKHDCDLMCERLAAYLEGDLTPADQATAERHLAECAICAEVLAELRVIAAEAATLPLLAPSRDLWSEIEARISTPLVSLGSAPTAVRRAPRRPLHFAMAAAALIAVSAGTTYLVVARHGGSATPIVKVATGTPVVNVAQQPRRPPRQPRGSRPHRFAPSRARSTKRDQRRPRLRQRDHDAR